MVKAFIRVIDPYSLRFNHATNQPHKTQKVKDFFEDKVSGRYEASIFHPVHSAYTGMSTLEQPSIQKRPKINL